MSFSFTLKRKLCFTGMSYRRKGLASLPITIFFIALVAVAFVSIDALTSAQTGLFSKQVSVENTLTARQQELSGLSASSAGNGLLQVTQNSGVTTNIVYAIAQTNNGQAFSEPVNYAVTSGQTQSINLTSLVQQMFNGNIPSGLTSITLVTSRGIYITSQVQMMQIPHQVTVQQQQQVQQASCPNGGNLQGSNCVTTYQATWHPGYYSCPAGWYLVGSNCIQVHPEPMCPNGGTLQGSTCVSSSPASYSNGYYSCPSGWIRGGTYCYQQRTTWYYVPGHYTTQTVWVPGYTATYQQCFPGYWTTSWTWVPGHWQTYQYRFWGFVFTYKVWVPGYWASILTWVPGYCNTYRYYVPGYYTTRTVWVPGYWTSQTQTYRTAATWHPGYIFCPRGSTLIGSNCKTYSPPNWFCPGGTVIGSSCIIPATWHPGYYSCPNGGTLQGSTCVITYQATYYTVEEMVPVSQTVYNTELQPVSSWLIGG